VGENKQLVLMVVILLLLGFGAVGYKHFELGIPLVAGSDQDVWRIEAKITFNAIPGKSVEVALNTPDKHPLQKIIFSRELSKNYQFEIDSNTKPETAYWRAKDLSGPQVIYFATETYFDEGDDRLLEDVKPADPDANNFSVVERQIAEQLLADIAVDSAELNRYVVAILSKINQLNSERAVALLKGSNKRSDKIKLAVGLLAEQGISARLARGIPLASAQRVQIPLYYLEVYSGDSWLVFDPRAETLMSWQQVLVFNRGNEPLLEVFGGTDSKVSFAILKEKRSQFDAAISSGLMKDNALINFSIYSLPIEEQAAFKLLLMIPLGALVVVVLRNLIGIRTSGTFMPILIAITFLQTTLVTGLILFLLIVGVGLVMRAYLTHLNLLLVPRIASVLVFVIVIYGAVGVVGHKLNLPWAASVTFFPMIILSWTIERMSILWEEEGWNEVFIQGGGSLLVAILAYFLMASDIVADTLFMFPELLLVVLAVIIGIGSYSGYRLSDLRRFEPMEKY
jgi:hypothetical protein